MKYIWLISLISLQIFGLAHAKSVEVSVDFAEPAYYPLLKGKASVFQEGLPWKPDLETALEPMTELQLGMFRGLVNQGGRDEIRKVDGRVSVFKNDIYSRFFRKTIDDQTLPCLTLNMSPVDFRPPGTHPKVPPSDLEGYAEGIEKFVQLYADTKPVVWEVWNEPQAKEFLKSEDCIGDYNAIFQAVAPRIRTGDPDAIIAAPAMANNSGPEAFTNAFIENVVTNQLPIDYYTIHNYNRIKDGEDRLDVLVKMVRGKIGDQLQIVPLVFTEYEYHPAGANIANKQKPREYPLGAVRWLGDLNYFIEQTDIPYVTWNRWQNYGRPGGLIGRDLRRRPIYWAYKFYGDMPVERKLLSIQEQGLVRGFASADADGAGVILWNDTDEVHEIQLSMDTIPFTGGTIKMYRIDSEHASYLDGTSDECLPVFEQSIVQFGNSLVFSIPAAGIVYLEIEREAKNEKPPFSGKYIRSWQWTGRTDEGLSGDYGDFDWRTWTARVGVKGEQGRGLCGVTVDQAPDQVGFQVRSFNIQPSDEPEALLGIRIDYLLEREAVKSVLLHNGIFDENRTSELPWAGGGSSADVVQMFENTTFETSLLEHAPEGWRDDDLRRVIVSFWIENTGPESQAVIKMIEIET